MFKSLVSFASGALLMSSISVYEDHSFEIPLPGNGGISGKYALLDGEDYGRRSLGITTPLGYARIIETPGFPSGTAGWIVEAGPLLPASASSYASDDCDELVTAALIRECQDR